MVPLFGALTRGGEAGYRRKMALKAVAISAGIFIVFALGGDYLLQALNVSVNAFKIAGGLLLFLLHGPLHVGWLAAARSRLQPTAAKVAEAGRELSRALSGAGAADRVALRAGTP